jgi:hypothetical protein
MVVPKQIIANQLKFSTSKCKLSDLKPAEDVQFYKLFRARTAILYFINCAKEKFPNRRKVLISPFTIPDLVNLIELSSVECDFYNLEESDLSYKGNYLYSDYLFVLVTHYNSFSISEKYISEIRSQTLLFEDGALAFGIQSQPGLKVGFLTDGVFYSFSSFKTLSFFTGGIAFLKMELNCNLQSKGGFDLIWLCIQIYKTIKFKFLTQKLFFNCVTFPILKNRIMNNNGGKLFARSETGIKRFSTMPQVMPRLIEYFLVRRFGIALKNRAHNNSIAMVYYEELKNFFSLKKPNPELDNYTFFHLYLPNLIDRRELQIYITKAGFDIGLNLYPFLNEDKEVEKRLIYLPCNIRISEKYARALSAKLIEFLC